MPAPVVVGVDDSRHALPVARAATSLASALDRRLVLVHAVPDPPTFPYGDPHTRELQRQGASREAERLLDAIVDALPPGRVQPMVRLGDHMTALAAVAQEEKAALIVVGSSRGLLAGPRTGGAATRLAAETGLPVMVVPPGASDPVVDGSARGSVVCGLDGSPESMRALDVARALASPLGLELTPVFADREGPRPQSVGGVVAEFGSARGAIHRAADRHDGRLIVVGSRGRGLLAGALLGSVSGALARSAPVPVVIVAPGASADGLGHPPSSAALAGTKAEREIARPIDTEEQDSQLVAS
jgi:nucleotide-binding universal stress UspA family protein